MKIMAHFTDLNGFHKFDLVEYPPPPVVRMPFLKRIEIQLSSEPIKEPLCLARDFYLETFNDKTGLAIYEER